MAFAWVIISLLTAMASGSPVPPHYLLSKPSDSEKLLVPGEDVSPDEDTLQQVTVVFRHGQRTPADTYPKDPHINDSMAPYGWGHLTNVGKLNQYDQGIYLRDRYDKFLGKIYSPEIFWLQSTGADRTKMSALLEAAGLWKPNDAQTFKDDLPWQPAVLHYQSLDFDTLLLARLPCPAYSMELERVKNSSEYRKILIDNKELLQQLSNLTGWDMQSPDDMLSLYGTLRAESDLNLTLPSWTKEYYPEKLLPLSTYSFTLNVYNDLLRRLKGGPLLKKILSDMVDKSRDTLKPKNRKMFMYAGHDSTVANLLGTMGVWDKQMPEYNIMAIVELHREKDNWNVQMFLRNTTEHEPYSLTVPGCSTICPLDRFIEITKPVIPINWSEECKVDDPNYVPPPPPMV